MAGSTQLQSQWGQLSTELWSTVFDHLHETQSQSAFYKLHLVCKRFCDVFHCYTHLKRSILINEGTSLTTEQVLSITDWIQNNHKIVQHFTDLEGTWTRSVLLVLRSHQASLLSMAVAIRHKAVPIVAGFKTLTDCTSRGPTGSSLDLDSLRDLSSLTALTLTHSSFTHVEAAAMMLTRLELRQCAATCSHDCMCVSSLVELELLLSNLKAFHKKGVAACTSLRRLALTKSSVKGTDAAENFNAGSLKFEVPLGVTALTNLTSIVFSCTDADGSEIALDWLTCLTNLQSLQVVSSTDLISFCEGLTCLTALTELSTDVRTSVSGQDKVRVMFDWAGLVSLAQLHIQGNVWLTDQFELSRLTLLDKLEEVVFGRFPKPDKRMTGQLALLAHELGLNKPHVVFRVNP